MNSRRQPPRTEPPPESGGARRKKEPPRHRAGSELLNLLLAFAALFILIAQVGFNPYKSTDWLGWVGLNVAVFFSEFTFGRWGAIALPLALILMLVGRFSGGKARTGRWALGLIVVGFYIGFAWAFIRSWLPLEPDFVFTGIIPAEASDFAILYLRRGGTIMVMTALALALAVVVFRISLHGLFSFLFYKAPTATGRGMGSFFKPIFFPAKRQYSDEEYEEALAREQEAEEKDEGDEDESRVRDYDAEPESEIEPGLEEEIDKPAITRAHNASGAREFPPLKLLNSPPDDRPQADPEELDENAGRLEDKLANLGVTARVLKYHPGPVITRYDLEPAAEVKVSRIASLADDIAMALRAKGVRILAPIPGEAAVGIEIPNRQTQAVYIREVIGSEQFRNSPDPLSIALGKDTSGNIFCTDLARMPHLLIAGATGSGKSVCINVIITSYLYRCNPEQMRMVLIDPKKIELSQYSRLAGQHLISPPGISEQVITAPENAVKALQSVHMEMQRRYSLMADAGVRGIDEYNQWVKDAPGNSLPPDAEPPEPMPYIVVVIDELADLMMTVRRDFEELVVRLAQMARAVGIHLVVATQRPSVDVVTGLIKANFPARIAFKVAQKVDSRTIIDTGGAEALLGRGDMLFLGPGSSQPIRLHGAMITTEEVSRVVEFVHSQPPVESSFQLPDPELKQAKAGGGGEGGVSGSTDELFNEAARIVVHTEQGSVSVLQRRLRVGYARAARLIDQLEQAGIVGPFDGSKARQVMLTPEELRDRFGIG